MSEIIKAEGTTGMLSTIKDTDHHSRVLMVNALNAAESLANFTGDTMRVQHIICVPGERASRASDQPDTPCINTYLIDESGAAWFSQSDGIARCAQKILAVFNFDFSGFPGGICPVQILETKLGNGNTLKSLKVLDA